MKRNLPKTIILIFICSAWSFARELYATIFFASRPDYLLYDALGAGYLFFVLQLPFLIVAALSLWLMLKPKILAIWYFFGQLYLALLIVTLYVVVATNNIKLAQETFLHVFRHAAGYRTHSRFTTWLYHIARNVARDELRTRRRRPQLCTGGERCLDETASAEGTVSGSFLLRAWRVASVRTPAISGRNAPATKVEIGPITWTA